MKPKTQIQLGKAIKDLSAVYHSLRVEEKRLLKKCEKEDNLIISSISVAVDHVSKSLSEIESLMNKSWRM